MRSLFFPLPLLLAPLAVPLIFASPAEAAFLPSCCGTAPASDADDREPEDEPVLVGARVRSPDERALEASAEAPITADAPLVNAIGIPLYPIEEDRRGVSEPERVTVPILAVLPSLPHAEDLDIETASCCQPPASAPEGPPKILVGAKVQNPDERVLEAAVEAQIEKAIQVISAIGIPLYPVDENRRGDSEPARKPAIVTKRQGAEIDGPPCCTARDRERQSPVTVDAPWRWLNVLRANAEAIVLALVMMVAIGFALPRRRRRKSLLELEPFPWPRPLPDELPQPDAAPVPMFEPEVIEAKARQAEREPA